MTSQEIEARKAELKEKIDNASTVEEIEELKNQVEEINNEVPVEETTEEDGEITPEEERSLIADTQDIETRSVDAKNLEKIGEKKMEERKFTIDSPEYRNAWAKTMLGQKLTEVEERAIGDAVGTTATEFVASAEGVQGINNLGLLIPGTVRTDLLERAEKASPIFRDIRKLQVDGVIDLPYLFESDDAEWYAELEDTKNEGQEFRGLKLTGHELAKDVVITWKAEEMTVEGFIDFIIDELYEKMYKAKINAVIYGDGNRKPTGITKGLEAKTGANAIEVMHTVLKSMNADAKRESKIYVATSVAEDITFYKDGSNNYPYLATGLKNTNGGKIEEDPFLKDGDIVVGNMRNYIFNENAPISIERERTVKGRKVTYGAYQICDGQPRPGYFGYGQVKGTV